MIIAILILVIVYLLYRLQELQERHELIIKDYLLYIENEIDTRSEEPEVLYKGVIQGITIK